MRLKNHYLVLRHGQTFYQISEKKLAYPWPEKKPILLTKEGEKQIEEAAKRLKKASIDFIYASDANRTRHSAGIIKKIIKFKKRIIFDKRLRDINLGVFGGKSREKFFDSFPKFSEALFCNKPKRGESWTDCRERLENFLEDIDKKYKNKNILIISHGDPIWLLEGLVKGINDKELIARKKKIFLKTGRFKKLTH
ncbi:MAG: hypothetical protein US98_C0034G0009 [Parcubacteria group bacterium GW2011_GWC1_38_6]|nr:MAG: Phosphoglycerate mutase [Parcubacteria group bacterium GW2011_GWA1_36_12]KKQ76527.1 MAG: hypothetical protein US98_C0034G0009 [Parcubacteria group bacterium GW2011_GWC1_38_6]